MGPLVAARIAVIDTARAWSDLTSQEREAIHRGERTICGRKPASRF